MLRRLLGLAGLVLASVSAQAGPQTYAVKTQTIRAGILILDSAKTSSQSYGRSVAPYAWYNLDHATGIKPAGWTFANPRALTYAYHNDTATVARLKDLYNFDLSASKTDLAITKRNASYWEVPISQFDDGAVSDYDVLLANPTAFVSLSTAERARLLRFVDQGGVLWVDASGLSLGSVDEINNFPLAFGLTSPPNNSVQWADYTHPLLGGPASLAPYEVNMLQGIGPLAMGPIDANLAESAGNLGLEWEYYQFRTVVAVGASPTVSVARIGDGFIVVTTRGISEALNRASGGKYLLNTQWTYSSDYNTDFAAASPVLEADGVAAAKFAVNLVSLASSFRQQGGGSRKTSASSLDIGTPLLQRFIVENGTGSIVGGSAAAQPVIYKGVAVASANDHIVVYSTKPNSDLDGDGNPDDGIQDASLGSPYDEIWTSNPSGVVGPISSPACGEIYYNNAWIDVVAFVDSNGALYVYNLFERDPSTNRFRTDLSGGRLPIYNNKPIAAPNSTTSKSLFPPIGPTIDGGLAFVVDNTSTTDSQGRVWIADLSKGAPLTSKGAWTVGGNLGNVGGPGLPTLPTFTASPTVCYIPIQDGSGGADRVIYLPGLNNAGNKGPTIVSLWLGAKGETPQNVGVDGDTLTITPRASNLPIYFPGRNGPQADVASGPLGPKITLIDNSTHLQVPASVANLLIDQPPSNPGVGTGIQVKLKTGVGSTFLSKYSVRVDYTIDWGENPASYTSQIQRGTLTFPDNFLNTSGGPRQILGNLAISPKGTVFAVVGNGVSGCGGDFYAVQETLNRGQFKVLNRYSLYPKHTEVVAPSSTQVVPEVFEDHDGLTGMIGILGSTDLGFFTYTGGPTVLNGRVYVPVQAIKTPGIPTSLLVAFNAEPPSPQITVGPGLGNFSIVQPDFARTLIGNYTRPDVYATFLQSDFTYNSTSGVVTFDSLAKVRSGNITDCLSRSLPVIIRVNGQTDRYLEPNLAGGSWNPVAWYTVFEGVTTAVPQGKIPTRTPVVTGNSLFFGGSSLLPKILNTGNFSGSGNGIVWGIDVDVASSGEPLVFATPSRPWLQQMSWIGFDAGSGTLTGVSSHIRMPQLFGVTNQNDLTVRVNQAVLGSSTDVVSLAAGNGSLLALGDKGLYGFDRADILVCDEGRLVRFDSAGTPIYTSSSSALTGGSGGYAGSANALIRPSRAYRVGDNDLLVVDTGGNRVVRITPQGTEKRSISSFIVDYAHPPLGFQANEPLSLNAPRDVTTFSEYHALGATAEVTNQAALEYWVHYLIADQGNHRLVDVIDRYTVDPTTYMVGDPVYLATRAPNEQGAVSNRSVPQLGVLYWQTQSNMSGRGFDYVSINRVYLPNPNTGGRYVYVAGLGGSLPTRTAIGLDTATGTNFVSGNNGNGGVVVFDPTAPNTNMVFNQIQIPDLTSVPFWNSTLGSWVTNNAAVNRDLHSQMLSNVQAVTARSVLGPSGNASLALMISDANGVFEYTIDPTGATSDLSGYSDAVLGNCTWMLPKEAYVSIRRNLGSSTPSRDNPSMFRPMYARRLDDGEVLVVNGYFGQTLAGDSTRGEVIFLSGLRDLDPDSGNYGIAPNKNNLGFNNVSLRFTVPPVGNIRGIISPVFADRR